MVESFRSLFILFSLIGILVLATISFGVTFQEENGVTNTILEDERINKTFIRLGGNLSDFPSETQSQREVYESEIPERGLTSLIIFSLVPIIQKFTAMIVGIFNILIIIPSEILGIPSVVMGTLEAIFLVTFIIFGWSVLRTGR